MGKISIEKELKLMTVYGLVLLASLLLIFNVLQITGMITEENVMKTEKEELPTTEEIKSEIKECGSPCPLGKKIGIRDSKGMCVEIEKFVNEMKCCIDYDCPEGMVCEGGFCEIKSTPFFGLPYAVVLVSKAGQIIYVTYCEEEVVKDCKKAVTTVDSEYEERYKWNLTGILYIKNKVKNEFVWIRDVVSGERAIKIFNAIKRAVGKA